MKNTILHYLAYGLCFIIILMLSVFFLLSNLANKEPMVWSHNDFKCVNCQMNIVDFRFKCLAITPKGKQLPFDSIECMLGWGRINQGKYRVFFSDFNNINKWIPAQKVFILKSQNRPSPMGGGLSAYSSIEQLVKAKNQIGGVKLVIK